MAGPTFRLCTRNAIQGVFYIQLSTRVYSCSTYVHYSSTVHLSLPRYTYSCFHLRPGFHHDFNMVLISSKVLMSVLNNWNESIRPVSRYLNMHRRVSHSKFSTILDLVAWTLVRGKNSATSMAHITMQLRSGASVARTNNLQTAWSKIIYSCTLVLNSVIL
jgi:hypothetical protein